MGGEPEKGIRNRLRFDLVICRLYKCLILIASLFEAISSSKLIWWRKSCSCFHCWYWLFSRFHAIANHFIRITTENHALWQRKLFGRMWHQYCIEILWWQQRYSVFTSMTALFWFQSLLMMFNCSIFLLYWLKQILCCAGMWRVCSFGWYIRYCQWKASNSE